MVPLQAGATRGSWSSNFGGLPSSRNLPESHDRPLHPSRAVHNLSSDCSDSSSRNTLRGRIPYALGESLLSSESVAGFRTTFFITCRSARTGERN